MECRSPSRSQKQMGSPTLNVCFSQAFGSAARTISTSTLRASSEFWTSCRKFLTSGTRQDLSTHRGELAADFEDGDVVLLAKGLGGGGDVLGGEDGDARGALEAEKFAGFGASFGY